MTLGKPKSFTIVRAHLPAHETARRQPIENRPHEGADLDKPKQKRPKKAVRDFASELASDVFSERFYQ